MGKAAPWMKTAAQVRKRGEQTGIDTVEVHAVYEVDLEVVPLRRGFRRERVKEPVWGVRTTG